MGSALALAALLICCLGESAPEDLRQGARVITAMAAPGQLRRSMFTVLFPDGRPSQFVSFLFSSLGKAEWPDSESGAATDPILAEQAAAIGIPLVPDGVAFTDRSPKPELGRQIVVGFDDARSLLIVEAYVDPTRAPVLSVEREFRLPTLRPDERELLERLAESNLELGASAQAF
jgi:hypothetical protein